MATEGTDAAAQPRWKRRKEARPAEIVDAAMDVFAEKGFSAAKLDDIAGRAGVAKGTLYRYFDTKEDVFRAVARQAVAANLEILASATASMEGSIDDIVPVLLARTAERMGDGRLPALVRLVIAESPAFPEVARIWHDDVLAPMLGLFSEAIAAAQARGDVRPGDPRLFVFSIMGPMFMGLIFRQVFGVHGGAALDLRRLASQHADLVREGLAPALPRDAPQA